MNATVGSSSVSGPSGPVDPRGPRSAARGPTVGGMARIRFPGGSSIEEGELELSASRSGGPGGQHANTSDTRVELRWHVGGSSLSDAQKQRVRDRLGSRITKDDVLILTSAEHRSQHQNREAVVARFRSIVGEAMQPVKRRRRTRVSRNQKRKRLEDKRRRSEKKRLRKDPKRPL